jgi:hypothetical protein
VSILLLEGPRRNWYAAVCLSLHAVVPLLSFTTCEGLQEGVSQKDSSIVNQRHRAVVYYIVLLQTHVWAA